MHSCCIDQPGCEHSLVLCHDHMLAVISVHVNSQYLQCCYLNSKLADMYMSNFAFILGHADTFMLLGIYE